MPKLTLTCLGAAGTVTGSRHLLQYGDTRILIDCGLFQGLKPLRLQNWATFPVEPSSIEAVVLTHAHLDHSGYIPKLVREGFEGPVICSAATAALCEILWPDSAHLQEQDADFANRHGFSKHSPALPLYGMRDVEPALKRLSKQRFEKVIPLPGGAELIFHRAGHILGAAIAEIRWGGRTVVFSGDLGRYEDAVMEPPETVAKADYLVVESTYGDRLHDKKPVEDALAEVIDRTVHRGGTVVIPAFAVGRAQELIYHLWRLRQEGRIDRARVFLDSPMAIAASGLMGRFVGNHRLSPDVVGAMDASVTYCRTVDESKALTANQVPKVIISASGMATGGRVLHHLKAFGTDKKNTLLFSGFQAAGTRGADLVAGKREVKIHGQWIQIRAEIAELPMLSAHADADELMRWTGGFDPPPKRTFIVHGEQHASVALQTRIEAERGWTCLTPIQGERHILA
jgi:metallo-beta-lactamase family protein